MNLDPKTVQGFGSEWKRFKQDELERSELQAQFERYFSLFPWESLPKNAEGFDLGCGSGRWADFMSERVGKLHLIDASIEALSVARERLSVRSHCDFIHASVDAIPLKDHSQDFGYSLGVLHHVPDTEKGIEACVKKLKPGAPFLVYLYYALDNRPIWFRALWRGTNLVREGISRLPERLKHLACEVIAATVYWPLSRFAKGLESVGGNPASIPLSFYRNSSFYTLRTDALDRFGTRLEQRFTRIQIEAMMKRAGLENIQFREDEPYWVAIGTRVKEAL